MITLGQQFFPRQGPAQPAVRRLARSLPVFTPEQSQLIKTRRDLCRVCPKNHDREFRRGGADAVACDCKTCQAKPLLTWKCPLGIWDGKPYPAAPPPAQEWSTTVSVIVGDSPFAAVKVISLKRTPQRLADFWSRWPADWPWQRPEVFDAVDGNTAPVPKGWSWFNANRGAIGCRASWLGVVESLRQATGPVLVMEDDCQLVAGAAGKIAAAMECLPADWDILFIGGEHNSQPRPIGNGLVRCTETGRTHGVIVHPRYFQNFLSDVQSIGSHVDWALRKMASRRNFYALDPFVALQGENFSTLRNQQEPPRAWDSRVQLPGGKTAHEFSHAGDVGDILYALPTIRAMTGDTPATLYLHPVNYTRRRMCRETVDQLRPLLIAQPYIAAVEYCELPHGFDLNAWRKRSAPAIYNLADRHLDLGGWCHGERDRPWLSVEPRKISRVLFARSPRYHNPKMCWPRLREKYPDAVFVGLPEEHADFVANFGPIEYHATAGYLELAQAIAGCELFAGNQSTPYAIAEAMNKRTIQEQAPPPHVNCHFDRPGATYIVTGNEPLPAV